MTIPDKVNTLQALGLSAGTTPEFSKVFYKHRKRPSKYGMGYWKEYRKCLYDFKWTILKLSFIGRWVDSDDIDTNLELLELYLEIDKDVSKLYRVCHLLESVMNIETLTQESLDRIDVMYDKYIDEFKVKQERGRAFEVSEDYHLIDSYYDLSPRNRGSINDRIRDCQDAEELDEILEEIKVKINDY